MGEAGITVLFIYAADAVPHHLQGSRRAMIFLDNDMQAIGQGSLKGGFRRFGLRRSGAAYNADCGVLILKTFHGVKIALLESQNRERARIIARRSAYDSPIYVWFQKYEGNCG